MAHSSNNTECPEAEDTSVFALLSRLSEILVRENKPSLSGKELTYTANKARSSMYGTLLGKSHVKDVSDLSDKFDHMNPLSRLISWRFIFSSCERERETSELNAAIKEAFSLGWDDAPDPILRTLVCLADATSLASSSPNEPFCLSQKLGIINKEEEGKSSSRIYPPLHVFKLLPWMSPNHSVCPLGAYVTSFPFDKEPGKGLPLFEKFIGAPSKRNTPDSSLYQLRPILPLTGPTDLTVPSNLSQSNFEDEGYFTPMTEVAHPSHILSKCEYEDPTKVWSEALQVSLPERKSWETLGNLVAEPEPPFLPTADSEALHHLSVLVDVYEDVLNPQGPVVDPKPTPRTDFVRDIFFLLIGIDSINFPFIEENDSFVTRKGMWLEGYCVSTTQKLCQDFLFCGTHFRRLEKLSNSQNTIKNVGLVVRSLLDCVQRWTQFYRAAVLILSSKVKSQERSILLFELLEYTQSLKKQVECLSSLCCIDDSKDASSLPNGVALLAHIYREACKSNAQQSNLLYSALKSCCEVYLHCLQRWIFFGDCTVVESNEFFVSKDPIFSTKRDRSFWVRGFVLEKSAVPGFLQGLEVAVFDCGRAMNLLHLCSPQHPLCVLLEKRHPTIHCCLYKSDMEKVYEECARFEEEAQMVCGEFINVSKLLEKESEQEAQLHILMQRAQKQRDAVRASLKMRIEKERAEMRDRQNAVLKAQILEMQQRKAAEKERSRKEDEQYLLECKRLDDAAKLIQEEERQKVIAHYEELGRIVDKQNQHREWQLKRLQMADVRHTFLLEDSLNLAKEHLLFDKVTKTLSTFEVCDDSSVSAPESQTSHSQITGQSAESRLSLPMVSESIITDNCGITEEKSNTSDVFREASAIKTKVLQIEFGIVPEETVASHSKTLGMGYEKNEDKNICESTKISSSNPEVLSQKIDEEGSTSTSSSGKNESDCGRNDEPMTDLVKNRQRILTEDKSWKLGENISIETKTSSDSGLTLQWERNKQKILGGEYNIITGMKVPDTSGGGTSFQHIQRNIESNVSSMSDLQRNRMKVLGEEYDILTGEKSSKSGSASISVVVTKADSGIETLLSECDGGTLSGMVADSISRSANGKRDEDNFMSGSERPKILSFNSVSSCTMSPLTTPHGFADMPVFTSPFKGTNHLPNELPLASPLADFCSENPTHFEIHGIPLTVDIADSFASRFDGKDVHDSAAKHAVNKTNVAEMKLPNTSWLESSLQTCLLLPLRVQYRYVSAALLHYFLVDLKLLNHFRSLRSYYFMQDGEFGRHLTVKLFTQMYQVSTPDKLFNTFTLDRVIKESLASSQGTADPNHDLLDLAVDIVPHHFSHFSPNALDCLRLRYKVKWPLNLLLTPDALEKYNLIFLFLVRLKRVAWLLQEDFVALKNTARGCLKEQHRDLINSPQYHQVQMIRRNMSQFVQATLNYVCSSVLHTSWTDFASSLMQATTLDHIYNAHIEYIKRLLKRCLLNPNSKRVEAVLSKILICIIKFHGNLRVRPWQMPNKIQGQRSQSIYLEHPNYQQLVACSNYFKLQVCKLVSYLERLISPSNQQQHLSEYLQLLNINGFYKSSDYIKLAESVNETEGKSVSSSQATSKVVPVVL